MARDGQPARQRSAAALAERDGAAAHDRAAVIRDEAQRLRDYAEAAADWFWETDEALRFTRMSASTQLPTGASGADFIGRRIGGPEGPELGGADWQALNELLAARPPFRDVRLNCRFAGSEPLYLSLSGVPVFDAGGVFTGYRGIGRDLTLLVRAEADAET